MHPSSWTGPEENRGLRSLSSGIKRSSKSLDGRGRGESRNDLKGIRSLGCINLEDSRAFVVALRRFLICPPSSHFQRAQHVLGKFSRY